MKTRLFFLFLILALLLPVLPTKAAERSGPFFYELDSANDMIIWYPGECFDNEDGYLIVTNSAQKDGIVRLSEYECMGYTGYWKTVASDFAKLGVPGKQFFVIKYGMIGDKFVEELPSIHEVTVFKTFIPFLK